MRQQRLSDEARHFPRRMCGIGGKKVFAPDRAPQHWRKIDERDLAQNRFNPSESPANRLESGQMPRMAATIGVDPSPVIVARIW